MKKSYSLLIGEGKSHQTMPRHSAETIRPATRWAATQREAAAIRHFVERQRAYLLGQQLATLARELRLMRVARQTGQAAP
jgi:hypothetical protein